MDPAITQHPPSCRMLHAVRAHMIWRFVGRLYSLSPHTSCLFFAHSPHNHHMSPHTTRNNATPFAHAHLYPFYSSAVVSSGVSGGVFRFIFHSFFTLHSSLFTLPPSREPTRSPPPPLTACYLRYCSTSRTISFPEAASLLRCLGWCVGVVWWWLVVVCDCASCVVVWLFDSPRRRNVESKKNYYYSLCD